MTIAVERAAEAYQEVAKDMNLDEEEVKEDSIKLLKDVYVDDGTTGASQRQADRMLGYKMKDGNFSGTVPRIRVTLKLKPIMTSESSDQESLEKLSDKVLGYLYNYVDDKLGASFTFNPAKKRQGAKVCPDLTLADVDDSIKIPQSRRTLLATCNAVHIPLGLVDPITTKLKVLLKEFLSHNCTGDWDPPASTNLIKEQTDKRLKETPQIHITHNSTRIMMGSIQFFSRMSADYITHTFVLENLPITFYIN